jgi:hypothetical protein
MPKARPTSPTLLTSIAFTADFPAWILVVQKLINRKDASPIPSQPKNITRKLSAVTKISIKKVNNDKYPRNRVTCGSDPM